MKTKRIISTLLALVLLFTATSLNVHASQSSQIDRLIEVATRETENPVRGTPNKYTRWFGYLPNDGGYAYAWCHAFVSWCANQAGISKDIIPRCSGCCTGMDFFKAQNRFYYRGSYTPKAGDIIYFYGSTEHVGIVTGCSNGTVYTIEGNTSNTVKKRDYQLANTYIVGYGAPNYENSPTVANPTIVFKSGDEILENPVYYIGDTITITWDAVYSSLGEADSYDFKVSKASSENGTYTNVVTVNKTNEQQTFAPTQAGAWYKFEVRANVGNYSSEWSQKIIQVNTRPVSKLDNPVLVTPKNTDGKTQIDKSKEYYRVDHDQLDKLYLGWTTSANADKYRIDVKALTYTPNPGNNEEGEVIVNNRVVTYTSTDIEISDIDNAFAKIRRENLSTFYWVKVSLQALNSRGDYSDPCYYYFRIIPEGQQIVLNSPQIISPETVSGNISEYSTVDGSNGVNITWEESEENASYTVIVKALDGEPAPNSSNELGMEIARSNANYTETSFSLSKRDLQQEDSNGKNSYGKWIKVHIQAKNSYNEYSHPVNRYFKLASLTGADAFKFDASTGTITDYLGNDGYVEVPSTINGVAVKKIGNGAFLEKNDIVRINIANGIESIGACAFQKCKKLKTVQLPESITSIGSQAFMDCVSLQDTFIEKTKITKIQPYTFANCTSLKNIEFPSTLTKIHRMAFLNCTELQKVIFSQNDTNVVDYAFHSKNGSEFTPLPNLVFKCYKYSGAWFFAQENEITIIELGTLSSTEDGKSFQTAYRLESLDNANLRFHENHDDTFYKFSVNKTEDYYFYIKNNSKYETNTLIEIFIYDSGKNEIYSSIFESGNYSESANKIHFIANKEYFLNICVENSPVDYYNICLEYHTKDENGINYEVYSEYASVESYEGDKTKVIIPETIDNIPVIKTNKGSLEGFKIVTDIYIPSTLTDIDAKNFSDMVNLQNINVDNNNPVYTSDTYGALYSKDMTKLISFPSGKIINKITLPQSLQVIGEYCFGNGNDVSREIEIYNNLKEIQKYAFWYSYNIEKIYFYGTQDELDSIIVNRNNRYFVKKNCILLDIPNDDWNVESIYVDKNYIDLNIGTTTKINETVYPENATNKEVTWTSSNESVATVSSEGIITAVSAGTAIITVTTVDGGYTASCTITVIEGTIDENAPKITIKDIKAKPGQEVQVTVDISNNTGFASLGIEVGYDENIMTLTGVAQSNGIGGTFTTAPNYSVNPYNMGWDSATDITYNGNLATLTFKVNENAPDGIYPITLDYYKGVRGDYIDGEDINYNEDFDAVGFVYVSGNMTVASYTPGDLNGDGKVNNKDATYLLRYLARWDIPDLVTDALDVDGSGTVNNKDATVLLRYLAGWNVVLK